MFLIWLFLNMKSEHQGMVLPGLLGNIERHVHTEMTDCCIKRNSTATTNQFCDDAELEPVK
jgi:hypothetical protein